MAFFMVYVLWFHCFFDSFCALVDSRQLLRASVREVLEPCHSPVLPFIVQNHLRIPKLNTPNLFRQNKPLIQAAHNGNKDGNARKQLANAHAHSPATVISGCETHLL